MKLLVTSHSFQEGDRIPEKHSARGRDLSPPLQIDGITEGAQSIAVTFDDASHPLFPNYNHWVIWNIPVQGHLPEAIPRGPVVDSLGGAIQGRAYGKNRYKGPKPPFKAVHTYVLTVFILDCLIDLSPLAKKADLLGSMEGHILQQAALSGTYQSRRTKT
ncbi:MAG: YbhB/YbcL family Raf kinase inhibitor-like protein [Spirochaetales bacterium]|nr:YbhB/YbcL family Raf kinase inhibitor-like protein [Spirochaetales bacterium]MCF7938278.1 YbhB/YbcL family Raf kinase inhibitor-like protein [Spirochaetales bacterium]